MGRGARSRLGTAVEGHSCGSSLVLVTRDTTDNDADVFGESWPLVDEWRGLVGRPSRPGAMA